MKHRYQNRLLVNPYADGLSTVVYQQCTDEQEKHRIVAQNGWLRPYDDEIRCLLDEANSADPTRLAEINERLIQIINERIYAQLALPLT